MRSRQAAFEAAVLRETAARIVHEHGKQLLEARQRRHVADRFVADAEVPS